MVSARKGGKIALTAQPQPLEKRRVQCAKCPWRKDVDPYDIPNGYCPKKHAGLRDTIAEPGALPGPLGALKVMACHETPVGGELVCVGWLANQLGPGNNLALRLAARRRPDLTNYKLVGEQHERFEDTLPKGRKRRK